jgi:tRNA-dihydrouridine synthase
MTQFSEIIPQGALLFAPMEGITDTPYRLAVGELYPQWDYFCTDFLRIPTEGHYSKKKIIHHYGERIFHNPELKKKTALQILTTVKAQTEYHLEAFQDLGFEHLDLNLGCPSKKVNSHGGGAFLLSELSQLKTVLSTIRKNYNGLFTIKIRLGFRDDLLFEDIIKLGNDEGVDAITIHGRTRDMLYKGKATWEHIKKAAEISRVPIIGNGDVWSLADYEEILNYTNCYAVMCGRGAMKTPWLAKERQEKCRREDMLKEYFKKLHQVYQEYDYTDEYLLKRFKALSRYLFDDFENGDEIKKKLMRSHQLSEFYTNLEKYLK